MKVNTDGVLLGALMTISPGSRNLLDVGTGTGAVALMAAQRLSASCAGPVHVDAVDVDAPSVREAAENFASSPWASSLSVFGSPLQEFVPGRVYDHIFSNPPYFEDSLANPDSRKADARHTASLSYRDIFAFAAQFLSAGGLVSLILPSEARDPLLREARSYGFFPCRIVDIRTTPAKAPRRIVAEFSRTRVECPQTSILTIQEEGRYTSEYAALLKDFLIIF